MNELLNKLFSSDAGKKIYSDAKSAISDYGMLDYLRRGVLLGLSGGADSVALLLVLLKYKETYDFKLKAVHVNHCIRGAEADFDENFSGELCKKLNVEFFSYRIDVPEISKNRHVGLEEAARDARYEIFNELLLNDSEIETIAVAHNATDNLETVIFNIMRGSGLTGVSGIAPIRDNIIRPLIYSPKNLITQALSDAGISFVTDSTNKSSDYSRNFIRNEIIPKLTQIHSSPELMCTRLSENLRDDDAFLTEIAENFIKEKYTQGILLKEDILGLKKPIFSRVLKLLCKINNLPSPEKVHIDAIFRLCRGGNFSYSLPGKKYFISDGRNVYIKENLSVNSEFFFKLQEGLNVFEGFDSVIVLTQNNNFDCYSNIYKISIHTKIKFDIISDGLYIRSKNDGDSYRYGKMTRKLKKLFNDKKMPTSDRINVPIFCDSQGILWVPGLKIRDGADTGDEWHIFIAEPHLRAPGKRYFSGFHN